ncbi:hypothetical protein EG832_07725 [bacterium]|nr:hypothetical protein [bacterium]
MNEEPEKNPEDMPLDEEPKTEETKNWWEKAKMPEPIAEESVEPQEGVIVPEASHEEAVQAQIPPVVPKAVESTSLTWLKSEEIDELKSRWNSIQVQFVDEPRKSVEQADALVEEVLKRINQAFTDQRAALDAQWVNQEEVSTEDLRVTLQSYRSFFNRFLAF